MKYVFIALTFSFCNLSIICSPNEAEHECVRLETATGEIAKTEELTTEVPRSVPLGTQCDTKKNNCQCYGKRSLCGCSRDGWCTCRWGNIEIESEKQNCPNKEEWESKEITDETTTEVPRTLFLGEVCDTNKTDCQCFGMRSLCGCGSYGAGTCICRLVNIEFAEEKKKCPNREEWQSEEKGCVKLGDLCGENEKCCKGQCFTTKYCQNRCLDCVPKDYECDNEKKCCDGLACKRLWYTKTRYCQDDC